MCKSQFFFPENHLYFPEELLIQVGIKPSTVAAVGDEGDMALPSTSCLLPGQTRMNTGSCEG